VLRERVRIPGGFGEPFGEQARVLGRRDDERRLAGVETGCEVPPDGRGQLADLGVDLDGVLPTHCCASPNRGSLETGVGRLSSGIPRVSQPVPAARKA
jgi:hypothetical protein